MLYKITKVILIALFLFSITLLAGISMGWIGMQYALLSIQVLLITLGCYVFYETRLLKTDKGPWRFTKLLAHVLILPATALATVAVLNERFANNYWLIINIVLIVCLGIVLINLLLKINLKSGLRIFAILYTIVYLLLMVAHMIGYFSHGKYILMASVILVLFAIFLVLFGAKKTRNQIYK